MSGVGRCVGMHEKTWAAGSASVHNQSGFSHGETLQSYSLAVPLGGKGAEVGEDLR